MSTSLAMIQGTAALRAPSARAAIAQQFAPGLARSIGCGRNDDPMIGKARRQRADQLMHRGRVGALHDKISSRKTTSSGLAQVDRPVSANHSRLLAGAARRVEDGEVGVDEDDRPYSGGWPPTSSACEPRSSGRKRFQRGLPTTR